MSQTTSSTKKPSSDGGGGDPNTAYRAKKHPDGSYDLSAPVLRLSDLTLTDETAHRNEYHTTYFGLFDSCLKYVLRDERDLPLAYLQLNITTFLIPLGIVAVCLNSFSLGVAYIAVMMIFFFERFVLMLHFSSHKKIYRTDLGLLGQACNAYVLYVVCPFFGLPPGLYYLHHVIMHHSENNHGLDVSETESYDRTGVLGFFRYWVKFSATLILEMPLFAAKTGRWSWFWTCVLSSAAWLATILLLGEKCGWIGTAMVFCVPHVIGLTAMSLGNYAQHVFIDPDAPFDNYGLAFNCLNTEINQTTFNDGYHIIHHIYPRLHWTELPSKFLETKQTHREHKALTFRNTHFLPVAILVLTNQIDRLAAEHYVHIDLPSDKEEDVPTVGEIAKELRRRMERIEPYERKTEVGENENEKEKEQ